MTQSGFKRSASKRMRAFSLAELMIATGILGIGMIIVAMAFPVALDQSRLAVEMTTSQTVFNEAVNKLKTQVKWTEIENYAAVEPTQQLGTGGIWLIDFDATWDHDGNPGTTEVPVFQAIPNSGSCQYSGDDTYGWMAVVQKIGNQTYKFWIFILREPTGISASITNMKFNFRRLARTSAFDYQPNDSSTGPYVKTKRLRFNVANFPVRQSTFLGNNGKIYRITDLDSDNSIVACDQVVSDGNSGVISTDDISFLAYPEIINNTVKVTRKNPVVAVYETVISY